MKMAEVLKKYNETLEELYRDERAILEPLFKKE